jgi:hypothetical protein
MRSLLVAAAGVAIGLLHQATGGPHVDTILTRPGTISAFAQDDQLIAWFTPGKSCNTVHVASLVNPLRTTLPQQAGAVNVTCRWRVGSTPVRLALAGDRAAWTLRQASPISFDYLIGASVSSRKERRFQEFAHTKVGAGLWLGGVTGDHDTLAYAIASVDYVDEAGCLTGTATCALKPTGGGVYRLIARQAPKLVPGTDATGAVLASASDGAVAYVPSADVAKDGHPVASAALPIQIVDAASGDLLARAAPQGVPLAISLARAVLATLERSPDGSLRIAWYDRATGMPEGSVPVAAATSPELAAGDEDIVYRVDRTIRDVDTSAARARTLTRAGSTPVGLSIEGRRVAWAENLKGTARIRALYLTQ